MRATRMVTLIAAALAVLALVAGDAEAAKKKRKKKGKAAPVAEKVKAAPKADTRAVGELMGPFKWGMKKGEVLAVLNKQIDERYTEEIKAITDVFQQDALRKKAGKEKERIARSWVSFQGQKTGWDVSIIEGEFGHKNDEGLLVYWENDPKSGKDQRRFFFFVDDKLWKMFIAFNADMFQGKKFADFSNLMEARYGKGGADNVGDVLFLRWRAGDYYLRAIDLTQFYGNFCLAISDQRVEGWIAGRRQERNPAPVKATSIVDSVTEGSGKDDSKPSLDDPNKDVINRLTGAPK